MMERLHTISVENGKKINIKQTKVMKINKGEETVVRNKHQQQGHRTGKRILLSGECYHARCKMLQRHQKKNSIGQRRNVTEEENEEDLTETKD